MDLDELSRAALDQGWRIEQTTKGVMLYPPDKQQGGVLVHRQPTEQALKKTVSLMRRRGFIWPPPRKGRGEDA